MKTTDLFKINKQASRLNESLSKTFGQKLNLENFDLHQLQDARNKIRTQLSQLKSDSGFNENLENEAYHKAQFMLDTLNAEIMEREEFVIDSQNADDDTAVVEGEPQMSRAAKGHEKYGKEGMKALAKAGREGASEKKLDDIRDKHDKYDEDIAEVAPPGAKAERMVKHIKKGYADDGKLTDKEKGIAYATAWKQHNKEKNESIETGEDMTRLQEGEIQQASAIVTAKTMVDRVGRWIEELSGMENDTLLQLGDSIRDEMSSELAKTFISTVAPAIQQALQNLKDTRETLATGVRTLTGEEQGAEMLGAEPGAMPAADMAAEPDAMNAEPAADDFGDEFAAADAAAGGAETAGREQRESIQYQNRLLKVLAG
jgi:hypothetical protein